MAGFYNTSTHYFARMKINPNNPYVFPTSNLKLNILHNTSYIMRCTTVELLTSLFSKLALLNRNCIFARTLNIITDRVVIRV